MNVKGFALKEPKHSVSCYQFVEFITGTYFFTDGYGHRLSFYRLFYGTVVEVNLCSLNLDYSGSGADNNQPVAPTHLTCLDVEFPYSQTREVLYPFAYIDFLFRGIAAIFSAPFSQPASEIITVPKPRLKTVESR